MNITCLGLFGSPGIEIYTYVYIFIDEMIGLDSCNLA